MLWQDHLDIFYCPTYCQARMPIYANKQKNVKDIRWVEVFLKMHVGAWVECNFQCKHTEWDFKLRKSQDEKFKM
jgi:hypothetical protein